MNKCACGNVIVASASGRYKEKCVRCKYDNIGGRDVMREKVRIRDNHTCQECGKIWIEGTRRFDIHHLNGLCGKLSRAYDRKQTFSLLITLCHKCHLNLPEVKEKMINKSSPRLNKMLSTVSGI